MDGSAGFFMQQTHSRKRELFELLAAILQGLSDGEMARTHIMYSANLNFKRLPNYLVHLEELGLATKSNDQKQVRYCITEKGRLFLRRYEEMTSMLEAKA